VFYFGLGGAMTIKSGLETPLNKNDFTLIGFSKQIRTAYACAMLEFHLLDSCVISICVCSCLGGGL
jgi:hypothetical protein